MNILFITPSVPSKLHRIRSFNLIKYLGARHNLHLLTLSFTKIWDSKEIEPYCSSITTIHKSLLHAFINCFCSLFLPVPMEVAYCRSKKMERRIGEMVVRFSIDLIYIKRLRSAQFVSPETAYPLFLDTTDAMSLYYRRAMSAASWMLKPFFFEEWFKYRIYEKKMLRCFHRWIVCSEVDKKYLQNLAPKNTNIFCIPNGVDLEMFNPHGVMSERHTMIFSGIMDKFVNIEAAEYCIRDILPLIFREVPRAKLYIVGPNPSLRLQRCAARDQRIIVTGLVDDPGAYIARSEVVLCPVKTGAGTRNKILQAWSMGRPVVTTSLGLEGLEAIDGVHVLIADTSDEFAQCILRLFQDNLLKKTLTENGLQLVQKKYSMDKIVDRLDSLLQNISQ